MPLTVRMDHRVNTSTAGLALLDVARGPRTCIVRDRSEGGARVRMARTDTVPNFFMLQIDKSLASEPFRPVVVVWRRPGEIGVAWS